MRVMSRRTSEILDKLLRLAGGDARLVDRAIRATRRGTPPVTSLEDLTRHILDHRAPPEPRPRGLRK